jgi:hypothetical protein
MACYRDNFTFYLKFNSITELRETENTLKECTNRQCMNTEYVIRIEWVSSHCYALFLNGWLLKVSVTSTDVN